MAITAFAFAAVTCVVVVLEVLAVVDVISDERLPWGDLLSCVLAVDEAARTALAGRESAGIGSVEVGGADGAGTGVEEGLGSDEMTL